MGTYADYLEWDVVSSAAHYDVLLRDSADVILEEKTGILDTKILIETLLTKSSDGTIRSTGDYRAQVQSVDKFGNEGDFSAAFAFTVGAPPSPSNLRITTT